MSRPKDSIPKHPSEWWMSDAGFFGRGYMRGDNSLSGYLPSQAETLEQRTRREAEGIVSLLNIQRGQKLIDVPCGYGRHVFNLAQRGILCTGIDINKDHLDKAQHFDRHNSVRLIEADMRFFSSHISEPVDFVTNMFFSFGFFESDDDNQAVLREFHSVLKPGGQCLIHTDVSPEIIANGSYRTNEERKLVDGLLKIEEFYDPQSKRLFGKWTIVDSEGETTLTPYSVRIYGIDELKQLLESNGFSNVHFFGGFNGKPFDSSSEELIVTARK